MFGSDDEPKVPLPHDADEQMRAATERLRDLAWMVSPLTAAEILPQRDRLDVDN